MPLGFGNWEATVTSITGLVAKENVVATVGIITSLGEVGEADPAMWACLRRADGRHRRVAIMAFCAFNLLCAPCFAAIGTIRRQMSERQVDLGRHRLPVRRSRGCVGLLIYQLGGLVTGEVGFNLWTVVAAGAAGADAASRSSVPLPTSRRRTRRRRPSWKRPTRPRPTPRDCRELEPPEGGNPSCKT